MFVRITSAITAGSIITFGVFYIMQSLIAMQPMTVDDRPRGTLPVWIIKDRTTPLVVDEPLPTREFIKPPVTPETRLAQTSPTGVIGVGGIPATAPPVETAPVTGINPDGPLVNVIRVKPDYPAAMAARGVEGWVVVQFDVTPQGTVSNAFVVSSSHAGFERSALKAIARFRYKARVVDGTPVGSSGLQTQFTFTMNE
ncbi:MAG: TonB family protein [Woeseiaceae bacterium]|nr:TonB family protein [Woeseiaceae bacterium]